MGAGEAVDDLIGTADTLVCIIIVTEAVSDLTKGYEQVPIGSSQPGQHKCRYRDVGMYVI